MDIATLKIAIDTREALTARRVLISIEDQAGKTEKATIRMAKQSTHALGDMSGFIGRVAGALAAANLAQQFIRVADSVTVLNNQLKLAMGTAQAAGQAYKDLYIIAQQSRVSFTSLGGTFAQIRRATEDTGLSYGRLLTVTEAIGNAMAVSGGAAHSMNAALIQLQQGLASGTLRGEELNSVMEQTPRLAQAIADGLGITRGQLRAMGQDGKLTSDAVIRALESQAGVLKGEVANSTLTAGQAYTVMANATTKMIGQFDQLTGASAGVASAMKSIGSAMDGLGVFIENNKEGILAITGALAGAAVVAGIVKMAGAIGLVTAAFTALTAVIAANPVGLVLLGIGAVGGAIAGMNAYNNAFAKTREGMVETIKRLEETNKSVEKSIYGPPKAAAMQHVEARRKQIEGLRKEIEKLDAAAIKAGGGSGSIGSGDTALMREQGKAYAAMAGERQKFIDGAMTATQKMNAELEKARKAFGGMIPQNVEEAIRGKYAGAIEKATDETRKLIDAGIELQKSLTAKDSGLSPEFAKQLESLDAAYKSGKLSTDQLLESQRLLLEQQPFMIDAAKREADAIKEAAKAQEAMTKLHEDSLEAQIRRVESLQTEEAAVKMARELNVSLAQAVEMVNIAKLKEQQIAAMRNPEAVAAIEREIEERKKLIDLIGSKEAREASTRAAEKSAADWKRTAEKIEDALTDSLMRGFERGKDFGQNLKDTLENMFKTMVLRPVIQAAIGGIGLGGGNASAGGVEGMITRGVGKILNGGGSGDLVSSLRGLMSGPANFLTGKTISAGMAGGWTRVGDWLSTSSNNTMANAGSWMQNNPQAGAYLGMAGNAMAGYGISRSLSGGYKVGNKDYVSAIAGIASAIPSIGPIAGLVGAAVNRAFGMKAKQVTGESLRGSFSESGADTSSVQSWSQKGGWFRRGRSGTNITAVTGELDAYMDSTIGSMFSAAREAAQILRMNADAINGFSQSIDLNLIGLNEEQRNKAINDALGGFGDALAQKLGAESMDALVKFAQQVMQQRTQLENQLLQLQGNTTELRRRERDSLHESNRAIYDQIKALQDQAAANEKAAQAQAEANAKLQAIATERASLQDQLDQLLGNTEILRARERAALHESNRAIYDQIKALEDSNAAAKVAEQIAREQQQAAEQIRSAWKSIGDGLMDEVNRIRGMVASESGYSLAYLQSEFAILTAATRAGDQVAGGKLSGVASAISEAAAMEARSALELAVMRSNVANSLERTNQIVTGAPVSVNTPILTSNAAEDTKAMRSQIEALNARINELTTNSKAENQAQFNALNRLVSIMDNATQGGSMAVRTINGETVKTS
jgi:tape measure domain-containing protein